MLVKNILIEDNNGKIRVEVSDANMSTKRNELKISMFIDSLIEDLLTDDDFEKLIKYSINKYLESEVNNENN